MRFRDGDGNRTPLSDLPDLVHVGVGVIARPTVGSGSMVLNLIMEPVILNAGVAVITDSDRADFLLNSITAQLRRVDDGGHRGGLIQHLLTLKLRLHKNLRGAISALVEHTQRESRTPTLPPWSVCP